MGYMTESPEMGTGIIYDNPLYDPNKIPAGREPTATPTAPTVPQTTGGGGGAVDTGKKGPTFGGGSSVVMNPDSPSGYTYVAGISGRTGQMVQGWIPNGDARFTWDYSPTYGLVDTLTYDDMIDPAKRYKPPSYNMENPFAGVSFEMPTFEYPNFPQYQMPAYPTMPTAPTDQNPYQNQTSNRTNKRKKMTILTSAKGTDDDARKSALGSRGSRGAASGVGARKRRLLG